jgi:hypothetical protein
MQNIAEIMADYNEVKRQEVLAHTWGHLAAKKDKQYRIKILFSESSYGGQVTSLIESKLYNGLEDSPWLYDAILDRINKAMKRKPGVYLINGIIRNYRVIGKAKKITNLLTR